MARDRIGYKGGTPITKDVGEARGRMSSSSGSSGLGNGGPVDPTFAPDLAGLAAMRAKASGQKTGTVNHFGKNVSGGEKHSETMRESWKRRKAREQAKENG